MKVKEKLMKSSEAAKFLGITRMTLNRWIKAGKIVPMKTSAKGYSYFLMTQLEIFQKCNIQSATSENIQSVASEKIEQELQKLEKIPPMILPSQHYNEITKLGDKLSKAEPGEYFKTAFDKTETIFVFARLDYENDEEVKISKKLDKIDDLILNAIYSFSRAGVEHFTARNILQHVFGNVSDHFQEETVGTIEEHLEKLSWAKLTLTHKDSLGNDKALTIRGQQYFPSMLRENLLDVTMLELKSKVLGKRIMVYRLNRKSALFKYAESLNQITSWAVYYMAVPCRRTIQNAIIINYLLTKIALIKNQKNHYLNVGILFDTLFLDLQLDVNTRKKKKAIRDVVRQMMEYWVQIGLLYSYKFEKMGQAFYKIVFNVNLSEVIG